MNNYYELLKFKNYYFEDSYILDINKKPNSLELIVDTVITESHPDYREPHQNEKYCYKRLNILFLDCTFYDWRYFPNVRNVDSDGSVDYGNIDVFSYIDDKFHMTAELFETKFKCSLNNILLNRD